MMNNWNKKLRIKWLKWYYADGGYKLSDNAGDSWLYYQWEHQNDDDVK